MKKFSKKEIEELKNDALNNKNWKKVKSFKATKPTSIRLDQKVIKCLQYLAEIRGENSYQKLLKRWVQDKVDYEMSLISLAKKKGSSGEGRYP